jgi:hypothetical protein
MAEGGQNLVARPRYLLIVFALAGDSTTTTSISDQAHQRRRRSSVAAALQKGFGLAGTACIAVASFECEGNVVAEQSGNPKAGSHVGAQAPRAKSVRYERVVGFASRASSRKIGGCVISKI